MPQQHSSLGALKTFAVTGALGACKARGRPASPILLPPSWPPYPPYPPSACRVHPCHRCLR
eukprot:1158026-Pelagomonas_calceolata.AAC.6